MLNKSFFLSNSFNEYIQLINVRITVGIYTKFDFQRYNNKKQDATNNNWIEHKVIEDDNNPKLNLFLATQNTMIK